MDNASGLNSFSSSVLSCDILGNQTFRPNVTSASTIQTDQGSTAPVDFDQFMFSMKDMFRESVKPSTDAINKTIDSIVTTNSSYGKTSLPTSNSAYPQAKRLRSPQQFSVPSACDQLENESETASTISTTMGNMFCNPKISAGTMNDSEDSASSANEQTKDFIQGFTTFLGNKSSGLSHSEFISKAWFEAMRVMICQMDGLHYILIKLGPGILSIPMLMLLMHRT